MPLSLLQKERTMSLISTTWTSVTLRPIRNINTRSPLKPCHPRLRPLLFTPPSSRQRLRTPPSRTLAPPPHTSRHRPLPPNRRICYQTATAVWTPWSRRITRSTQRPRITASPSSSSNQQTRTPPRGSDMHSQKFILGETLRSFPSHSQSIS